MGRQPWVVYGLLRTSDAFSRSVQANQVMFSIILFGIVYLTLFILFIYLLTKKIVHGPSDLHINNMETFLGIDYQVWWFLVFGAVISGYAILDGFDLGAGALHLFLGKEESRRIALNAIGPVWDGNEVWLVIGGGALFAGFPIAYAAIFSAFYIPFMVFIVGLIWRGVAIEFRSKEPGIVVA